MKKHGAHGQAKGWMNQNKLQNGKYPMKTHPPLKRLAIILWLLHNQKAHNSGSSPYCKIISFLAVGEIYSLSGIANQCDRARVRAEVCCLYILNFSHHNNSFLKLLVVNLHWRSLLANAPHSVPELCRYYSRIPVNQSHDTAVAAM